MTSKDLAIESLNHKVPERLPWTLYLSKPLKAKLTDVWGPREQWPCPPDDIIRVLWPIEWSNITDTGFQDMFGCPWRNEHGGYTFIKPPMKEPDAKDLPRIELVPQSEIDRIIKIRNASPDCFIFYQFTGTLGERLWCLRGMTETMTDYLLHPKFVHEALDILLEMHFAALDKILCLPIDGVTFGDDYGTQRGLMISREVFLTFYKPRLAKLYEKVRSAGKVVMHHSCGDNTALMGDFIDIGLQVFHPLQPEAMDIKHIKKEYGRHLTFRGGIGTQGDIVFGTPDEARAVVRQAVEVLGKGGGYFLETAKPLPEDTPIENAMAVIEELVRVMHYQ